MKKSRVIAWVLLVAMLVMSFAIVGCGGNEGEKEGADSKTAPQGEVIKMQLGHIFAEDMAPNLAALEFAKRVKERTDGRVEISVFPNTQLGGDREMAEAIQRGDLAMGFINQGSLTGFDARFDFPNLYIADGYEMLDKLWFDGGWIGQQIAKIDADNGMHFLALGENDFRHISNNVHPITKVSDMKGLKFRVPPTAVLMNDFKEAGGLPIEMGFGELYTGLQQKTIDGQENGVLMTYTSKLYEVQPYFTHSFHSVSTFSMVVSEKIWPTLPEDVQKVLQEVADEISVYQREINREQVKKFEQDMADSGVEIAEFEPEELVKWEQILLKQWKVIEPDVGKELLDELKIEVNKVREELGKEPMVFPE